MVAPRRPGLRGARQRARRGRGRRRGGSDGRAGASSVDSDFLAYFDRSSPVRRDHELINQQIVGSNPFYLIVEGGAPGTHAALGGAEEDQGPADLHRHAAPASAARSRWSTISSCSRRGSTRRARTTSWSTSRATSSRAAARRQSFWENSGQPAAGAQPDRRQPEHLPRRRQPRLLARQHRRALQGLRLARDRGDARAASATTSPTNFPAGLRVVPTGSLVLITGTSSSIVFDQIKSVSLALLVIFAVMALMLLSARIGLLAILPNVLAIDGLLRHPRLGRPAAQPRHQPDRHHRARHRRRFERPLHVAAEPRAARRVGPGGGDPAHHARRRRADAVHHPGPGRGLSRLRRLGLPADPQLRRADRRSPWPPPSPPTWSCCRRCWRRPRSSPCGIWCG